MKATVSILFLLGVATADAANAQCTVIDSDITVSTTWTADQCYSLDGQIYVRNGATLTIEAGTVIASDPAQQGALAVTRGAQIQALGESGAPIIFTSTADVATWDAMPSHPTGSNPATGVWRESANEWGNVTIMGNAYISENAIPSNVPTFDAGNIADMEGLQNGPSTDRYGGGNDDDDSGTLRHVSFRYGGRVIGLANELNGLSLGGIGRGTDLNYVEIMNNVDDGIEIWGGTVNVRHFSIWNIGDDSLDIDQGWRGKAQFGLIVQGFSLDASQGSGVGDNGVEHDGAENCNWQPRTRGQIANLTFIGQPLDGDGATAWRDNCGMQYYNSIFMDGGEQLVRFDNDDGDGACGYGIESSAGAGDERTNSPDGTRTWVGHWNTNASQFPLVNESASPGQFYTSQRGSDRMCDIERSVFFRNLAANAYTEADLVGVRDASNNNITASNQPIVNIVRNPTIEIKGGRQMLRVLQLDPTPQNDAIGIGNVPADGFFAPVNYAGAFAPGVKSTWLCGWTASHAFGFTSGDCVGVGFTDSNANETGQVTQIRAYGSTIAAQNDLCLQGTEISRAAFAYFINADMTGFTGNPAGGAGNILLGGGFGRHSLAIGNSGQDGVYTLDLDLTALPRPTGLVPVMAGDTWYWQLWHRDSQNGTATSNFSHRIAVTFE